MLARAGQLDRFKNSKFPHGADIGLACFGIGITMPAPKLACLDQSVGHARDLAMAIIWKCRS